MLIRLISGGAVGGVLTRHYLLETKPNAPG